MLQTCSFSFNFTYGSSHLLQLFSRQVQYKLQFENQKMDHHELNWYIQYDYKVFDILNDPMFHTLIYQVADLFRDCQGPTNNLNQEQQLNKQTQKQTQRWISEISESIGEIIRLMYNFFNVQYKLSKNQTVKTRFTTICSVLKIQGQYCRYFFTMSQQFRVNRILACCLRLNKFMACIMVSLKELKKNMDKTLLDNLNEVYLFMQQRIIQTLQVTRYQDHVLNIILLDMMLLLQRNAGDPTMKPILDTNKEKQIINNILKSNQIYDEFMRKKQIERKKFEQNKYFEIQNALQQDPTVIRKMPQYMEQQQYD